MKRSRRESHSPVKVFGQRSIISSSVASQSSRECEDGARVGAWRVSLSQFLDRKLKKTSTCGKIRDKVKQFSTPLHGNDGNRFGDLRQCRIEGPHSDDKSGGFDGVLFEQFKPPCKANEVHVVEGDLKEGRESQGYEEGRESRKRTNPFGGENRIPPKHVIVMGYRPEPKQEWKEHISFRTQKKRRLHNYNHYANGGGFWDHEMEGIDSEEVGCEENWEGIGSTTLGGIDWN